MMSVYQSPKRQKYVMSSLISYGALLSLDTSVREPGFAVFTHEADGFKLRKAFCVQNKTPSEVFSWLEVSKVVEGLMKYVQQPRRGPLIAVSEFPRVIGKLKNKPGVDPNSTLQLAATVGAVAQTLDSHGIRLLLVRPNEWKGSLDKDKTISRVLTRLSEDEKACVEDAPASRIHNTYDAIGIGLFVLGRFAPNRAVR